LAKMPIIIRLYLRVLFNMLQSLKKQSRLKISFVFLSSFIFLVAEFIISYHAFMFIRDFPGVGSILTERLMYLFYFILLLMLIFSNAIVAYSTVFRSRDTTLLFTWPILPETIFRYKFLQSAILSSWAFLVLLIPFMVSFGIANRADIAFYPAIMLLFIPFLIIAGVLGSIITIFFLKLRPLERLRWMPLFIILTIGIFLIYIIQKRIRMQESGQTIEIFILNKLVPNIKLSHSPFWPSYWTAEGILKAARTGFKDMFFYFLVSLSTALLFIEILISIGRRFYFDVWVDLYSRTKGSIFSLQKYIIDRLRPLFFVFGSGFCGLIIKDIKLFFRDASQWSQFLIFFGILGAYFLNIRNFSYHMLEGFWKNMCAFLNLSAVLLTLGSLNTRFLFPQMSLEGNKYWIIGMSPLGLKRVLYQKFWVGVIVSLFITETLIIVSSRMLGLSGLMTIGSVWTVFVMNFALVGLSIGFGGMYPDLRSDNPTSIVSGFGGTLTLILNIGCVLIAVVLLAFPFQLFLKGWISSYADLKKATLVSIGLITVLSLSMCILPLLYGAKALEKMEF